MHECVQWLTAISTGSPVVVFEREGSSTTVPESSGSSVARKNKESILHLVQAFTIYRYAAASLFFSPEREREREREMQ